MGLMETGAGEVKGGFALAGLGRGLGAIGRFVLDQLYPPVCAGCDAPLAIDGALCAACFAALKPITAPLCPILGLPFAHDFGEGAVSAQALADPPPFRRARAAVAYGPVASGLVSPFKYADRPEVAVLCARLMAGAGAVFWAEKPVLVPVPLHPSRYRQRRYNQSLLLAQALGQLLDLPVDPMLVRRQRKTRQQVGLSGDGRERNVQGAFVAHPDLAVRLRGRPIVLLDDVYTTGSTVKAVTRALQRGGAGEIDILTFARVVIGDDLPI